MKRLPKEDRAGLYITIIVHLVVLIILLATQLGVQLSRENTFVLDFTKAEQIEQLRQRLEFEQSVNDRDYERDRDAQQMTIDMGRAFDGRALQNVPVISSIGIDYSGNGRDQAHKLAAVNGTDGKYMEALTLPGKIESFGISRDALSDFEHPSISFQLDEDLPYTAETFAKFNQQEMKSQNKTEQAVKLGKTVSDDSFKGIVRTINGYDTLGDFYNDAQASLGAVYNLHNAGVVPQAQLAEMVDGVRGQERLSAVGREFLENMLIGKAFESDPEVVRMLTAEPAMRQTVITALGEVVDNIALGGDWSLQDALADAVKLCFDARQGGAKYGDIVSTYARQGVLFADPDELQTVADFNHATMLMLADVLNDKRVTLLRTTLQLYNKKARESAVGETDAFAGGILSREDILRDVINFINENYGKRKEIEAARAAAVERRKAESVSEDGTPPAVSTDGEAAETEERGNDGRGDNGRIAEWSGGLSSSEEIDENGIPFVKAADGTTVFGEIREDSGLQPAPIRLSEGFQDEDGKGYGLAHIEANHGEQIRSAGFASVEDFVAFVAQNYDEDNIRVGKRRENGNTTYLIQVQDEHDNTLFIEMSRDGSYWNVNSAGIFRKGYSNKKETVAKTEPQQPNNAVSDGSSLSADEESGITSAEPNGEPTVSAGKDSENPATVQGKGEKVAENQTPSGDTGLGEQPKATVNEGEDYVDAAVRIAKENEVKRTAAHFPMETQEEAAAFDKRVPKMDDAELLAYMQEDGKGDVNKSHHPSVYDEYDYRHGDEQIQSHDATLVRLNESGTTLEQAEEMLANLQKDKARFATEDRADLLGQEEALQEYIDGLEKIHYDRQGNPVDADGDLILEEISSVDELKGEDFSRPSRNVQLPKIPEVVDKAIGANGKPVIIKKNIFEKNKANHPELKPSQSRKILKESLYSTNLYGQTQPKSRPNYWVVIRTSDPNRIAVLEVSENKDNVEIVGWRYAGERQLEELRKQAEREDGQLLILTSEKEAAAGLSTLPSDVSAGKEDGVAGVIPVLREQPCMVGGVAPHLVLRAQYVVA